MATPRLGISWDFAFLRSPLLPRETWRRWTDEGLGAPEPQRRAALRAALREAVRSDLFTSALACASSGLLADIAVWERDPQSERGLKIERALVRYFTRACTRPTPFGLFAGVSEVKLGDATQLQLRPADEYRSFTQPTWELLRKHAEAVAPTLAMDRKVRANPTLHEAAGLLRCVQPVGESFTLSEFALDDYLACVWRAAQEPRTLLQLADALRRVDEELEADDISGFLDELLRGRVLIDDAAPAGQGERPLVGLTQALAGTAAAGPLHALDEALRRFDALPLRARDDARAHAWAKTSEVLGIEADARSFVTVLHKPCAAATLADDVLVQVEHALEVYRRVTIDRRTPRMQAFVTAFEQRFGDREVPLVIAADTALGVVPQPAPSATGVLANLELPEASDAEVPSVSKALLQWMTRLYAEAIAGGHAEIALSHADLAALDREPARLPASFTAGINLVPRGDEASDVFVPFIYGPSGTRISGRFGHAVPELAAAQQTHARLETRDHGDMVLAELNFNPPDRHGNVTSHCVYYDHEILCFDRPGVARDHQIPVNDLRLSIRDGEIVLRSARLDKRVIPRCSTAYHYPKVAFAPAWLLAEMTREGSANAFRWEWLHFADMAPFLPRVRFGRAILSLQRWNLRKPDLAPFVALKSFELANKGHVLVRALRERWQWPRFIDVAGDGDRLTLDLDNPLSVDTLVHLLKTGSTLDIEECLQELGPPVVFGPEGSYTHELFASGRCPREPSKPSPRVPSSTPFVLPGGSCLYLKLYGRAPVQDRILGALRDLLVRADAECDRWFFIRYEDPHPHLRLRFFGDRELLHASLLPEIHDLLAPLAAAETLWRLQLDSYEPEISRYGGPEGMPLAEQLFCADSRAYLQLLLRGEPDEIIELDDDTRLAVALTSLDDTLVASGWNESERLAFAERSRDGFVRELKMPSPKPLGDRFRQRRDDVARWLARDLEPVTVAALQRRTPVVTDVLARIRQGLAEGRIIGDLGQLLWSFNHMTVNRLMPDYPRVCEMLVYDYLARHYRASSARKKTTGADRVAS